MFEELHKRMNSFWNNDRTLSQTDPEFIEFFSNFAYDEVVNEPGANHPDLDDKTRSLAILAVLVGCQGLDAFEMMLPVAYETGLSSIAIKEMVYQATAYCGFGKTLPFLKKLNNFLGAATCIFRLNRKAPPRRKRVPGRAKTSRSKSSVKECVDSRNPAPKIRDTSTSGLPATASATTTRAVA